MRWWLAFVVLVLLAGEARADLKPHQREAGERIQKLFRHQPSAPVVPVIVPPVRVEPAPVVKTEQPKPQPKPAAKPVIRQVQPVHKPKSRQVQARPSYCGQIAMGVAWYGAAGMMQKARERGYSSGQIAAAMRACGYS